MPDVNGDVLEKGDRYPLAASGSGGGQGFPNLMSFQEEKFILALDVGQRSLAYREILAFFFVPVMSVATILAILVFRSIYPTR